MTHSTKRVPDVSHNRSVMAKAVDMLETALLKAQNKAGRGAISVRVARQNGRLGSLRLIVEDESVDFE